MRFPKKMNALFFQREIPTMKTSYKRLWHLLLDRDMKKIDLEKKAGLTHYAMNKLTRNEVVTTEVLAKVCKALDCGLDDIMELVDDNEEIQDDIVE